MARIETRQQKMLRKFREFVIGRMKVMNIKQDKVAYELCISQQAVSYKIKNSAFDLQELMTLLELLEVDKEELSILLLGKEKK